MQKLILTISITIQIPEPPMPPTPASAKKPEPVLAKERSPVCRCHVRYGTKAA
ncbi:hypothetical protein I5Q83_25195 [Enterocloster clostridioformis]|uniref:hypothetical protein n=1 Tax=Enterocloster clostridioformis TaxID=1531 RepID=UPI0014099977|nr:hypothetical protein [Enterocloster clostridioformis]QQQ99256.1 hypothetical protein I5Q83_25195 [Enterocloster clostridioformis]